MICDSSMIPGHEMPSTPATNPLTPPQELVKPEGKVVDLRTAITGITKDDLTGVTARRSDAAARLAAMLGPDTILVGHSLSADLAALKVRTLGRASPALPLALLQGMGWLGGISMCGCPVNPVIALECRHSCCRMVALHKPAQRPGGALSRRRPAAHGTRRTPPGSHLPALSV
jgi:DNA polymerase III epsilon subunit-like protein